MSLRASPAVSSRSAASTPTLKQYRLDSTNQSISDDSEIEVCVDSVFIPDSEDLCCQMLQNRFRKQKCFCLWKLRAASCSKPVFGKEELESLKEQSNRNADAQRSHQRHKFLSKYADLARFSLDRIQVSRLFGRWINRFEKSRIARIQDEYADSFIKRKMMEKGMHMMRTALIRNVTDDYSEAAKIASEVQTTSRVKNMIDELRKTTQSNDDLENEIARKSEYLIQLQQQLREVTTESAEAEKRLYQVGSQTQQIQATLVKTEQKYQNEVAELKTQLSLSESETREELESISKELMQQQADRQSTSAFVGAAQAAAQAELEARTEKLKQAESVVRRFRELLVSSQERSIKLNQSKQIMSAELENLRIKKRQLEASQSSTKGRAQDKEEKLKRLIKDVQDELHISMNKFDGQNHELESQREEMRILQEEIQRYRTRTSQAHSRFIRSTMPARN